MRVQPYTVLIGCQLHEVKAETPNQAAKLGAEAHRAKGWLDDVPQNLFVETVVFVGKAPECIFNSCGILVV